MSYIPIMQAKEGELEGLENLGSKYTQHISPLLWVREQKDSQRFFKNISKAWCYSSRPIKIDAEAYIHSPESIYFFDLLTEKSNILPIAVTDPFRDKEYQKASLRAMEKSGEICLRLTPKMIVEENFTDILYSFMSTYNIPANHIEIIIDQGKITGSPHVIAPWVCDRLEKIKSAATWSSISFVCTSFPGSPELPPSPFQLSEIQRLEPILFSLICEAGHKDVNFGDYTCIGMPVDVRYAKPTPKIRYATDTAWLYIKGQANQNKQYYDLAKIICDLPEYIGRDFSWGDACVADRAEGTCGPGGGSKWVAFDVNHHITKILSSL